MEKNYQDAESLHRMLVHTAGPFRVAISVKNKLVFTNSLVRWARIQMSAPLGSFEQRQFLICNKPKQQWHF